MTWFASRRFSGLLLAVAAIIVGSVVLDVLLNQRTAEDRRLDLQRELASFAPPDDARLLRQDSTAKPGFVLVWSAYRSSHSYAEVRALYDAQLTARGWRFLRHRPLEVKGAADDCYTDGDRIAALEVDPSKDFDYVFQLSWGWSC